MYIYICMHIIAYMYVPMYTAMSLIHTYVCMCVDMHLRTYICTYVCICTFSYVHTNVVC